MRPKMEDKNPKDVVPAVIITSEQNGATEQTPTQKSKRKYLIIAGSAILAIAIILAAILVGMYLFTEGQKEILKFSYNRDDGAKEEVTNDPNTNIVQYHVTDQMYEMWVINDFNKDLQVMKIVRNSNTNCYVAPLNRSMAMDPSKVSAPADKVGPSSNTSALVAYRASNTTIPDSSFLSKTAKEACKGISTYWVYPMCKDPKDDKDQSRAKRYFYYWCNWDYSCCVYCYGYYWNCFWIC